MTYALKGPAFQAAVVSKSTAQHQKALRLTHAAVRAHLTPAQTAKETRTAVRKLATSFSAAALLLALPANAGQAASLFEGNTTYQQELQDLIDKRGSLPSLSPPDLSKSASDVKKAVDQSEFKLPDVAKGAIDTPKMLEKVLPEAVKNLPPPPTPTPSSSTPGQPKAETPRPPTPKLDIPKPPSLPTPPQPTALPQQEGGGLPTSYLAAGGVAAAAIVGIGLAGAKPDEAKGDPPVKSAGSAAPKSSSGSSSSMPQGKDPELDSAEAKKKDPFFEQVRKRSK